MSKKFISSLSFFILALGFFIFQQLKTVPVSVPTPIPSSTSSVLGTEASKSGELYTVTRVIDGDTIEVQKDRKQWKVRYVGVDTPETVDPRRGVGCFGHEASDENKKLVEGKEVLLEKDVSETDKFGRLLRFVYLKDDEATTSGYLFVNDFLVREGYAKVATYPPDVKFVQEFLAAQKEAEANQRGLWNPSTCNGVTTPKKS